MKTTRAAGRTGRSRAIEWEKHVRPGENDEDDDELDDEDDWNDDDDDDWDVDDYP
jgi:hypothetical protein